MVDYQNPLREINRQGYVIVAVIIIMGLVAAETEVKYNPCCSYPCMNRGVCYTMGSDAYACDCTRTGYYGKHCEYARVALVPEPSAYIGMDEYTSMDTYLNKTIYARSLPPIPENCPLPMGVVAATDAWSATKEHRWAEFWGEKVVPWSVVDDKGTYRPKILPNPEEFAKRFHLRKKFKPCPRRTNLLFPMFAQHFNHQYFKTDPIKGMPFQFGTQMIDMSHIYGDSHQVQNSLRSHTDGKMKVSSINGEHFPPRMEDVSAAASSKLSMPNKQHRFAFGHRGFGLMPSFLIFSTIWLREHNRVCDVLKNEHPEWTDERLFQTARLIITGETMKIIVEDYVQHLSGFHFKLLYDPDVMIGGGISYHNQIHLEFHTLYHWHPLVPDILKINEKNYTLKNLLMNPTPMVEAGMEKIFTEFNSQFAGAVSGGRNQGAGTLSVAVETIKNGRKLRLQPFNNYRRHFGMEPYKTFEDMTGETEMAAELRELYEDIEAVELYTGFILEKRRAKQLFGETLTEMGAPYSLKGIFGNPLGSPTWWKPATFGGEVGMNIIRECSLQKLVCDNVSGCPKVSFKVPAGMTYSSDSDVTPDDDTADVLMNFVRKQLSLENPADLKEEHDKTDSDPDPNNSSVGQCSKPGS